MRRLVLTVAVASVVLLATAMPASASRPDVELSRDGVTWGRNITTPLFDPDMRWVPGDRETASFYVRNNGGTDGDLAVDVNGGRAGELLDSGDLHVTARGGGGDWQTVSEPGRHRLLTALDLADGRVARIDVHVAFDEGSQSPTELSMASMEFQVRLSQSIDADVAGASANRDEARDAALPSAALPATGSGVSGLAVMVAAVLLGSGSALVSNARREERDV